MVYARKIATEVRDDLTESSLAMFVAQNPLTLTFVQATIT